ncbi:MAG TPA: HAD family phosphatase [Burkholderiaceae bacterium]|jgi:HAD superfamily hydrolase (TIGR01509 family)|nr:HAD family phosphatase [Burkholderiaceae bacterium]
MRPRFDAILFDCDGVLVDSEPTTCGVLCTMLCELGANISPDETMRRFIGKSVREEVTDIEALIGQPIPQGWYQQFMRRRDEALAESVQAVAGIDSVLDAAQAHGFVHAVASGADRGKMRITLGRTGLLDRLQPHVYGADQVERSKPHPDVYLLAARGLGIDPARCLVIEDTPTGTRAGLAAGATVLGYCGRTDPRHLLAAGASMVFDDMARLAELLRQ